jgi:hypothetical protein
MPDITLGQGQQARRQYDLDSCLVTGDMSECISVIVLSNLVGNVYQDFRGVHWDGMGPGLDADTLLGGATQTSLILILYGWMNKSDGYGSGKLRDLLNDELGNRGLNAVTIRHCYGIGNGRVDARGNVS